MLYTAQESKPPSVKDGDSGFGGEILLLLDSPGYFTVMKHEGNSRKDITADVIREDTMEAFSI
ncbi:MAG: hypothetical protein MRJ65_12760 [Candidatus Brocadiaceae bacterium]|nr:hypothetical protein [Candidatus Brocadiaceae bacterium]